MNLRKNRYGFTGKTISIFLRNDIISENFIHKAENFIHKAEIFVHKAEIFLRYKTKKVCDRDLEIW